MRYRVSYENMHYVIYEGEKPVLHCSKEETATLVVSILNNENNEDELKAALRLIPAYEELEIEKNIFNISTDPKCKECNHGYSCWCNDCEGYSNLSK